jgi:TolB-like protein
LKLLVLPFAPLANADRDAWIGRAISEALTADLSIDRTLSVSTDKDQIVDNADNALVAAKLAGVQAVVYGTFQNVGENVRVTGQIVDVATGKPVAGIKATGPLQELFSLQDSLVHQIEIRLGRPGLPASPPQPAPADSPLPLPDANNNSDSVLGVPRPTERRGIPWLNDELARTDEFARDLRTAHQDYTNNYPAPIYYSPVWGYPVGGWGVPFAWGGGMTFGLGPAGAVPFAPGVAPPGWRPATPFYGNPYDYYYPRYYYPPYTVSVTATDGDGWNGRVQTQGNGMVGGAMRATPKAQPYQLPPGSPYYPTSSGTGQPARSSNTRVEAVTHQVGNRQMPVSSLPVSPEVTSRRAGAATVSPASSARTSEGIQRTAAPVRPPVRTSAAPSSSQQEQPQNSQSGQTVRR